MIDDLSSLTINRTVEYGRISKNTQFNCRKYVINATQNLRCKENLHAKTTLLFVKTADLKYHSVSAEYDKKAVIKSVKADGSMKIGDKVKTFESRVEFKSSRIE